jgi:6-pyruvoyltetrahydropterin/6-carboxytetrahydropterin synthase
VTVTATRRVQFCAGHRVHRHESKCRNLHGHNYVALVTAEAPELDALGRVIDFGVLKEKVGGWIEEHWDHGFIYWREDMDAAAALREFERYSGEQAKLYILADNPTAENMAAHLGERVCPLVLHGTGVTVTEVTLWETENCHATWRR